MSGQKRPEGEEWVDSGQSNFKFEYLGEFETEFENILGHESEGQVVLIREKNQR